MGSSKPRDLVIIDDDITASESENEGALASQTSATSGKRKFGDGFEEKVLWTDESDQAAKPKKRKRQSFGRGKKKSRGRGKRAGRPSADGETESEDDQATSIFIPETVRRRRKEFDENRAILREAGLRLPPRYEDSWFEESQRLGELQEKPLFDLSSGVKPSRPYKDIELEYSGGLIPASVGQYLRDYQVEGVKFLHKHFVYQTGAILGDDMGLGKTVQVAAFLTAAFGKTGDERDNMRMRNIRRFAGDRWYPRVLIVAPGTLIQNWINELGRWGWWHTDVCLGSAKEDAVLTAQSGRLEVMLTTYQTYKGNRDLINSVEWDVVVADEFHCLKDSSSETTRAMSEVNAMCRIGLTGTAIQNSYDELWTLLNWTNPGTFGTAAEWKSQVSEPLRVGQSHDATGDQLRIARSTAKMLVQNVLPRYFLRRMKTLLSNQLPKKTDRVVFCPLSNIQSKAYANFLSSEPVEIVRTLGEFCDCGDLKADGKARKKGWCCYQTLPDGRTWRAAIFPFMMALQKMSNHLTLLVPNALDIAAKQESELRTLIMALPDTWEELYKNRQSIVNLSNPEFCGKWKVLKKLLRFWHGNGDKVLVFSHSVKFLAILKNLFNNTSYSVSYLDGQMKYEDRQKTVVDFNSDPSQFVFLISTKAGGVGLNITAANKVVIVDPHWNPSYDLQAQDRAYRIGQTRDVDVFRLVSAGTIEEIVYARQIYKQQQANIGYTASVERRYFKGVQNDEARKGEIFGLGNIFTYHGDQMVLREIVNKTNVAEAKAGINLVDVDMSEVEKAEKEAQQGDGSGFVKKEDPEDDAGVRQFAKLVAAKHEQQDDKEKEKKNTKPKSDPVLALLQSAGVEYTHENSEIIGSSKIEQQLSRKAEQAADGGDDLFEGDSALFADSSLADGLGDGPSGSFRYNPPEEVMKRQFCSMAREFGFPDATAFALVVESWTQEQRRNCLDEFYKRREAMLQGGDTLKKAVKQEVKGENRDTPKFEVKDEMEVEGGDVKIKMETKASVFLSDDEDDEL